VPIHYEVDDHIATITIDRPERRNALDLAHFDALAAAWKRFRDERDAWVAIITGVEGAFCAGADLRDYIPAVTATADKDRGKFSSGTEAVLRGLDIFKPIVAAVGGPCVAGGMEMLGGTDIRIACPEAVFGVLEPRQGLFAGGGTTARLPRQLAWPAAMEFLLTADKIPAERALQLGLINEVVPSDQLLARARDWARRITKNAPRAIAATKESALRGLAVGTLEEAYKIEMRLAMEIFRTDDAKEGPQAFIEKRPPNWTNG
jgi:enoyl-CoA hydratase